ncbi:hypothetical protein [Aeromicrobium sp.]|uniref:hypothetical protein n=1 Tax=Aeromicrobium sp. TaxID=1871063 RepID=UPI0030C346BC
MSQDKANDQTDTAGEAREGLIGSLAGKAKEVAGAVTGNDKLVEEGHLQQAEASSRKAAVADEAIADAKRDEAAQELRETNHEAAAERETAQDQADKAQSAVDRERKDEHAVAARDAERVESEARVAAEQRSEQIVEDRLNEVETIAADATATEQEAVAEKDRLEREAATADQQAAQLRAQTPTEG